VLFTARLKSRALTLVWSRDAVWRCRRVCAQVVSPFLPFFAAELVPGLDLSPTWSAAVFFATRQWNSASGQDAIDHDRKRTTEPEILDPAPTPARRV